MFLEVHGKFKYRTLTTFLLYSIPSIAEDLLTNAKVTAAAAAIEDEGVRNEILEYLNGK